MRQFVTASFFGAFLAVCTFFNPVAASDLAFAQVAMVDTSDFGGSHRSMVPATELEVTVRPLSEMDEDWSAYASVEEERQLILDFSPQLGSMSTTDFEGYQSWRADAINGKRWLKREYDWKGATGYPTMASNMVSASGQVVRAAVRLNEYEKPSYIRNTDATNDWTYAFGLFFILGKQYKDVEVGWN